MYLLRTSLGQFPVGSPRNVLLLLLLSANQYETNALSNWLPNYSIEKICVQMSNDTHIVSVQEYNSLLLTHRWWQKIIWHVQG